MIKKLLLTAALAVSSVIPFAQTVEANTDYNYNRYVGQKLFVFNANIRNNIYKKGNDVSVSFRTPTCPSHQTLKGSIQVKFKANDGGYFYGYTLKRINSKNQEGKVFTSVVTPPYRMTTKGLLFITSDLTCR